LSFRTNPTFHQAANETEKIETEKIETEKIAPTPPVVCNTPVLYRLCGPEVFEEIMNDPLCEILPLNQVVDALGGFSSRLIS
jgi:hypothetical protein